MFWDSSALVPTILPAPGSPAVVSILRSDPEPTLWWGSPVECQSALYRRARGARWPARSVDEALRRLAALVEDADVVEPALTVRDHAGGLLARHPLRAGDAFQLAAALVWCGDRPQGSAFVSLDHRLRESRAAGGLRDPARLTATARRPCS